MTEETPFKSMKITLSEEALARLDKIVKNASFRSYSAGIEECIRGLSDVLVEVGTVIGDSNVAVTATEYEEARGFERIAMRLSRFTGKILKKK
jgi:hypothetical protein